MKYPSSRGLANLRSLTAEVTLQLTICTPVTKPLSQSVKIANLKPSDSLNHLETPTDIQDIYF